MRREGSGSVLLLLSLLAHGCDGAGGEGPRVGSESHFLTPCVEHAECGGALACLCGVCSRACGEGATCGDLSSRATCEPGAELAREGVCAAPEPPEALCHLRCEGDADCEGLAGDLRCHREVCVPFEPEPPADCATARADLLLGLQDPFSDAIERPIVGGTVCVEDARCIPEPLCAETGADGVARVVGVPLLPLVTLRLSAPGYDSIRVDGDPVAFATDQRWRLAPRAPIESDRARLGLAPSDPAEGTVVFRARLEAGPGAPGFGASLAPAAGVGPIYEDDQQRRSLDATATSGGEFGGGGAFFDVPPGAYVLALRGPDGATCEPRHGRPGPDPGTVTVQVEADVTTFVSLVCR